MKKTKKGREMKREKRGKKTGAGKKFLFFLCVSFTLRVVRFLFTNKYYLRKINNNDNNDNNDKLF